MNIYDWNAYSEFFEWEMEQVNSHQFDDVNLWLKLARQIGEPILELGCGSGRITEIIAKTGTMIYGIDGSDNMISRLNSRMVSNLTAYCMDIRDFELEMKFKFAFYSYSTFQYLLTKEDQLASLKAVFNHLKNDGFLAIDICPYTCNMLPQDDFVMLYEGYFPDKERNVQMFTSHKIDKEKQITTWHDKYNLISKDGKEEEFHHFLSLKGISILEMEELLTESGFKLIEIFGDFNLGKVTYNSDNWIFLAKKNE